MKIGIVGNRTGWDYQTVKKKLKDFNVFKSDVIISGGADGVDTLAQDFAKDYGYKMTIFYPDISLSSPHRFYKRNQQIADYVDVLVAFNMVNGRCGTLQTINMAKKRGISVLVVTKEGDLKQ